MRDHPRPETALPNPATQQGTGSDVALKLRDPLGIARGLAESVPELVEDLRRQSIGAGTIIEASPALDDLTRIAALIAKNVTRALVLVEDATLPAHERRQPGAGIAEELVLRTRA